MAGRTPKAALLDEEMLASTWQWSQDIADTYNYAVQTGIVPTKRKGVWTIVARAHEHVGGRAGAIVHIVRQEWPSAAYSNLTGAILNAVMKLSAELEQIKRERLV